MGHRAVTGYAVDNHVEVRTALLGGLARVDRLAIDEYCESPGFIETEFCVEQIWALSRKILHAEMSTELFVRCGDQHKISFEPYTSSVQHQQDLYVHSCRQF